MKIAGRLYPPSLFNAGCMFHNYILYCSTDLSASEMVNTVAYLAVMLWPLLSPNVDMVSSQNKIVFS